MKILFNINHDLRPGQKKRPGFGGPRNFNKVFLKNFSDKKHQLLGIQIVSDQTKDQVVDITRRNFKDHKFIKLATFLRVKIINESKKKVLEPEVFSTIKILSQVLAEEKPDVLFLNGFSLGNWYLFRAAVQAKIPVVAVHHGLWFKEVKEVAKKVSPSAIYLMNQMEKDISKMSTKEVFLNEFSLKEYQKCLKLRINKKKLEIVPLPYRKLFEKKPIKFWSKKNQPIKIGMVGRWDPIKNPSALVDLAKEAKKQGKNWEFYFVCKIYDVKSLRKTARDIESWIKVLPPMKSQKLRGFYDKMDLMILPSNFDVSPTVVMEALLQNKMTLISPNVGWSSLYEKMALNNWIIDFKNPKKVVERIEENLSLPVSKKLVNYIQKNHQPKFVFDRYEKILKTAIKKK